MGERPFFLRGIGGSFAPNKPDGDEHFGTKCSHHPLLAITVYILFTWMIFHASVEFLYILQLLQSRPVYLSNETARNQFL